MATSPKSSSITPKVLLFIEEFLKDFNGTQAAIRAGYSPRTAKEIAYENLTKPHIKAEIERRKAELMAGKKMTLEKWVDVVTKLALYDPRKLFDVHGNPTEVPELGRLSSMALAGYEIEELFDGRGEDRKKIGYARKVKLLDRTPYIMALGKYLNAFPVKRPEIPNDLPKSRLPWESLSLEDRTELRNTIAKFIESKSTKTLDAPKIVNKGSNGGSNGHAH